MLRMKKLLFLLSLLLFGCTPSETDTLNEMYQTAKKEKDLIKLQNSLHNLSALESDTWQDEYISITQSNENIKLANEALSLGQLHDALNYAIKSSQTFYSKQASEVVSEVNKKAVNLKKLYIELNTLDKQKDSLNKRIAMIDEQDPKNWNIIEFNMLLVDLINIKNIFAKLASKLNKVINEGGIYVEASEQTTKQLALLDDSINILLSQVVKPVSHGLIKFSVSTSEQTLLNLNHFSDKNVPSMMASYYKKFNVENKKYTDLLENAHLVTFQNNYKGAINISNFYSLYSELSNPPETFENYEKIIQSKQVDVIAIADKAEPYIRLNPKITVYKAHFLTAFYEDLQQFMNE